MGELDPLICATVAFWRPRTSKDLTLSKLKYQPSNTLILAEKQNFRNLGQISNHFCFKSWLRVFVKLEFFAGHCVYSLHFSRSSLSFVYLMVTSSFISNTKRQIHYNSNMNLVIPWNALILSIPSPWILQVYLGPRRLRYGLPLHDWLPCLWRFSTEWYIINTQESFLPEGNQITHVMCTKSLLLKNKGLFSTNKGSFPKWWVTKMRFSWQRKLLQVKKFYTMKKVPNESFLKKLFKEMMCQYIVML